MENIWNISRFYLYSGYFMCIELKRSLDCEKVRQILLKKYDTGIISMPNNLIRVAFSSVAREHIKELFENIYKACKEGVDNEY